ncbi:radical SAM protein [Candidatus Pacearchaeota archaeon]|nr:radical SAM protein [Candidatus Pacearchaeota archaeon]
MLRLNPPPTLRRVATAEEIEKLVKENKISSISLRLPTPCNLNCVYCYGSKDEYRRLRATGEALTYNEIIETLNQAFNLGVNNISIVGDGEPLLYKVGQEDLHSLIDYINDKGASVILFTNATLITEELAKKLFKKDIVIVAKQNSPYPLKQNLLCGKSWAYSRLEEGIRNLIGAGFTRAKPSRLAIHTVICQQNYEDIPQLWRDWRRKNIIPYVQVCVPPLHKEEQKEFLEKYYVEPRKVRDLFHRLLKIDEEEFGYTWDPNKTYPIAALGCSVVLSGVGITPNGNVQMCAYTEHSLGNIREKSLSDILKSKRIKRIRRFKYSDGCFYGCRALTFNLTGNRFANDPFFWEK